MKLIHVYQHRIRRNMHVAPEQREPPVIIREGRHRRYASELVIHGPCRIVYSPDKPLSCGARLWISTEAEVEVVDGIPPRQAPRLCKKTR